MATTQNQAKHALKMTGTGAGISGVIYLLYAVLSFLMGWGVKTIALHYGVPYWPTSVITMIIWDVPAIILVLAGISFLAGGAAAHNMANKL